MKDLLTWLLGGALAASLSWNMTRAYSPGASCARGSEGCSAAVAGLAEGERARFVELCERACAAADAEEARADALHGELLAHLAGETPRRETIAELVAAIGVHRARALEACVDGVLELRGLLPRELLAALLQGCR